MSDRLVNGVWYGQSRAWLVLAPLGWLYGAVVALRRAAYRSGLLRRVVIGVPVVVVGNLTVGGTGKTPLAAWLAAEFGRRGHRPGIVCRGYRAATGPRPVRVTADADPAVVGDEALLLARESGRPVAVHPDRVAAARLLAADGCDLILADDGLQHYRLARDVEIAVVDGARGFGNGRPLPAGPLREPVARLASVHAVVLQGTESDIARLPEPAQAPRPICFRLRPREFTGLGGQASRATGDFAGQAVHAVAGIGNPSRFFSALEELGIDVRPHPLPDHAQIRQQDIRFADGLPVVMTSKDAVKCAHLDTTNCWCLEVDVEFEGESGMQLVAAIEAAIRQEPGSVP